MEPAERGAVCQRAYRASVSKSAVLVESRFPELLVPVVLNFLTILDDDWTLQLFGSPTTLSQTNASRLHGFVKTGKLILKTLTDHDWTKGAAAINGLLTKEVLWEKCDGDKLLVFQLDSVLCASSRHSVEDFLRFDWIGAAWSHYPPFTGPGYLPPTGGNGGLSIRNRRMLLTVLRKFNWADNQLPEDLFYSRHIRAIGGLVAGWGQADKFSTEGRWSIGSAGVHQPWIRSPAILPDGPTFVRRLEDFCPEYRMVGRYGESTIGTPTMKTKGGDKGPDPPPCQLPEDG